MIESVAVRGPAWPGGSALPSAHSFPIAESGDAAEGECLPC